MVAPMPLMYRRYRLVEVIGRGRFSQLIRAVDTYAHEGQHSVVAIKIMHASHSSIGLMESSHLSLLNRYDPHDTSSILRHIGAFFWHRFYCLVFELMDNSLKSVVAAYAPHPPINDPGVTKGLVPLKHVRLVAVKMLTALAFCERQRIIHADLKPENILLQIPPEEDTEIEFKLCDFGNAMSCDDTSVYYDTFELQSLPYRAPEVVMGLPFSTPIDMWSLGCTLVELFTGSTLFHSASPQVLSVPF